MTNNTATGVGARLQMLAEHPMSASLAGTWTVCMLQVSLAGTEEGFVLSNLLINFIHFV